ncbi:MAG: DUF5665 domain-containing protein [Patescibacteria group bacterium]
MIRSQISKIKEKVSKDATRGAQSELLEQLFNDHYKYRWRVYKMNFVRGIFFGLGSVIGATIIVSLLIWTLAFFGLPDSILNQLDRTQTQET